MKRRFDDLYFEGVRLKSIKHLPAEARAMQFVLALIRSAGLSGEASLEPDQMAVRLKRVWRANKTRIMPRAAKLRVETFTRDGEDFQLVAIIIRFQARPHKCSQQRIVGVCGTPQGFLWRASKLCDTANIS